MSTNISFKGKVVVVTGAGGGLGKDYALDFAKRGAKVVVNDLGGAQAVVDEIKKQGGDAIADTNNVLEGDKIIAHAVDAYGTVHVIINNAGILRDSSFAKLDEKKFRQVLQVHLDGAYAVTKAAWPIFRKQKYGRIVNASSPAGLYGNFGQTNYSAVKLALVGLTETWAKEGYKYNIVASAIAPTARSQMTEGILPEEVLKRLGADKITPLVVFLASENLGKQDSGKVYQLAGGFYAATRWERSSGELFHPDGSLTAEAILHKIDSIRDFSKNKPFKPIEHPIGPAPFMDLVAKAQKLKTPNEQGTEKVSLKNKVVLITGAGAGLGRAHAKWLAQYGAKVVVNDVINPHETVEIIKKAGGEAHPDKHNVATDAEAIIQNVINKYGRIDALINNAGILRDKSFMNMTQKQWSDVLEVHLVGTYKLCHAAWPYFIKQKSGNIVNITSTSGIYGSFGQANYAAAKSGILGFSNSLAIEGKKYGITVNVVAPHAETAMTKTIFTKEEYNLFPPELVSPILVLLSSDKAPGQGELFEIGGGWVGKTRLQTAKGAVSNDKEVTAEFIADNWKDINDYSQSSSASSIKETMEYILPKIFGNASGEDEDEDEEDEDEDTGDKKQLVDSKGNAIFEYTVRDTILYNIGVGAKAHELEYTYENDPRFQLIPSFGSVIWQNIRSDKINFNKLLNNFNPVLLLHGEQYIKVEQWPIPTHAVTATDVFPVAVTDKGKKAAILVSGSLTYDSKTGKPLFYNEMTTFNRGAQSASGSKLFRKREPFATQNFVPPQNTQPDFVTEVATTVDQASIYRLSGDYNPLHIDPQFAKNAKFNRPILHGLGYLGVSIKALLEHYGPIKEIKVRFSGSVYPGDRLKISGWKRGNVVVFQTYDLDTKNVVINSAAIKLFGNGEKL